MKTAEVFHTEHVYIYGLCFITVNSATPGMIQKQ
jgi:hypothetical protein